MPLGNVAEGDPHPKAHNDERTKINALEAQLESVTQDLAEANQAASDLQEQLEGIVVATDVVKRSTTFTTEVTTEGALLEANMDDTNVTAGKEPVIFRALLGSVRKRVFWLNEAFSARFAAVQSEPSVKIFKTWFANYTGLILQVLSPWDGPGSQQHIWGVRSDGNEIITVDGSQTATSHTVILAKTAPTPVGPPGTIYRRRLT